MCNLWLHIVFMHQSKIDPMRFDKLESILSKEVPKEEQNLYKTCDEKRKRVIELIDECKIFTLSDVEKWFNRMLEPVAKDTQERALVMISTFSLEKIATQVSFINYYLTILSAFAENEEKLIEGLIANKQAIEALFNERDLLELQVRDKTMELNEKVVKFLNDLPKELRESIGIFEEIKTNIDPRILEAFIQKLDGDKRKHLFLLSEQINIDIMKYCLEHSICFCYLEGMGDIVNEVLPYKFVKLFPIMLKLIKISEGDINITKYNTISINIDRKAYVEMVKKSMELFTNSVRMSDDMHRFKDFYMSYRWAKTVFDEKSIDTSILRLKLRRSCFTTLEFIGLEPDKDIECLESRTVTLYTSMCSQLMMNDFNFVMAMMPFVCVAFITKFFIKCKFNMFPFTGKPKNMVLAFVKDTISPMQDPMFHNAPEALELMKKANETNNDKEREEMDSTIQKLNEEYKKTTANVIKNFDDYVNGSKLWEIFNYIDACRICDSALVFESEQL